MVCLEQRRGRLGVKFSIPGIKDADGKTRFFRHTYQAEWTVERRRKYKSTVVKDIKSEIDGQKWKQLLERFPGNEDLHSCGLVAGTDLTMDKAFDGLEEDWEDSDRRSLQDLKYKLDGDSKRCKAKSPREYFAGLTPAEMTGSRIAEYRRYLKAKGYKNATINHKLWAIGRTLKLLAGDGKLDMVPVIRRLKVDNKRTGSFAEHELGVFVPELRIQYRCLVKVGAITGWRETALCTRTKAHVDDLFLMLDKGRSKNKHRYEFPLDLLGLREVLAEQAAYVRQLELRVGHPIEWLFPNAKGTDRIKRFDDAWKSALKRAGFTHHQDSGDPYLFHDLRRTATRRLKDIGLDDDEVMALVGHKTPAVHHDYDDQNRGRLLKIAAKGEAARAAQPPSNVIPLSRKVVPHVSHGSDSASETDSGQLKKASNSGVF